MIYECLWIITLKEAEFATTSKECKEIIRRWKINAARLNKWVALGGNFPGFEI